MIATPGINQPANCLTPFDGRHEALACYLLVVAPAKYCLIANAYIHVKTNTRSATREWRPNETRALLAARSRFTSRTKYEPALFFLLSQAIIDLVNALIPIQIYPLTLPPLP